MRTIATETVIARKGPQGSVESSQTKRRKPRLTPWAFLFLVVPVEVITAEKAPRSTPFAQQNEKITNTDGVITVKICNAVALGCTLTPSS